MGNCFSGGGGRGFDRDLWRRHAQEFKRRPEVRHAFKVVAPKAKHLVNNIKGWQPGKRHKDDQQVDVNYDKDLPSSVDLRGKHMPPVYQQGSLGSCTANAIAGAFQYTQRKNGEKDFVPSRLFIYYNERQLEGTVNKDSGAVIRDGMKTIQDKGVCHETTWPYEVKHFDAQPPKKAYAEAQNNQALKFAYVEGDDQLEAMKRVLHAGWPIIFGFQVPASFEDPNAETATSGQLLEPTGKDDDKGGHAVLAVGYDDDNENLIVRNSWGEQWGDQGYFYMPYSYVSKHKRCSDFWVLNSVEGDVDPGADQGQGGGTASSASGSNTNSSSGSNSDNDDNNDDSS